MCILILTEIYFWLRNVITEQYEGKLKREYIRFERDGIEYLKSKNPNELYKLFRRKGNPFSIPDITYVYEDFEILSP